MPSFFATHTFYWGDWGSDPGQNLQVTPGFQFTTQPSISNTIWIGSVLRIRLVL